ncbi:MAG: sigma-70 family RNA polymerase sigma factor [Planctomycetota bacterium]
MHADPAEELALLERARRGDRGALGELLRSQERRVYRVCLRMVSHPDDAAELAQDALVKLIQNLDGFRGEARVSTWVTRIAMNLSVSHLRKRRLRQTASLDAPPVGVNTSSGGGASGGTIGSILPGGEPGPASYVEEREELDLLQRAIAALDDDQRAVIVLRDLEQMDYASIARTLDIAEGTVKSRLFRARLALRDKLNPEPGSSSHR